MFDICEVPMNVSFTHAEVLVRGEGGGHILVCEANFLGRFIFGGGILSLFALGGLLTGG